MRIKKGLEEKGEPVEEEELMLREVNWKGENWKVGTVYIKDNMKMVVLKKVRK